MKAHIFFIKQMVAQGGPTLSEYESFTQWLQGIASEINAGKLNQEDIEIIRKVFDEAISKETMQGFAYCKPHGYPGDYEMIDKIYQEHHTNNPNLIRWDQYFHAQSAPKAVRNRKEYFLRLLSNLEKSSNDGEPLQILNVACGPARDLFEFLDNSNGKVMFDCIEYDQNAINYARELCSNYLDYINFMKANALKFKTQKRYKLIWSAGLFDYFEDKTFISLINRFNNFLDEEGELVIGNFSEKNNTKNYMEIMGAWYLNHRDENKLMSLALQCGIDRDNIRISQESEGVNLFLHIKRGKSFISTLNILSNM